MFKRSWIVFILFLLVAHPAAASIFGTVRGVARDEQGRPVAGVRVQLHAENSEWNGATTSDARGNFVFTLVPLGRYRLSGESPGLASAQRLITVESGSLITVDIDLRIAGISEQVQASARPSAIDPRSSTTQTTVSRQNIAETPGADRTNSLAAITDFVPGAYVVHDQLHVRGGHQVAWLIDGVPVPNTNIASNVGPQVDPKDIDYVEVQRGGYSAEHGDRAYSIFNVVPRSGFESTDEGRGTISYGIDRTVDDQFSVASHTERFAYYVSANVNHSDAGLATPIPHLIHDQESGGGVFGSLIALPSAIDQLRLVFSGRADRYQIPNDEVLEAQNVRDQQREHDAFVNASWLRTISSSVLLTVAPFFHLNGADFEGGVDDPLSTADDRTSHYLGAQATLAGTAHGHNGEIGILGFRQSDDQRFGLTANDGSGLALSQRVSPTGTLVAVYAEDSIDVASWLTVRGGLRQVRFSGGLRESATTPRLGVVAREPHSGVVFRASYGLVYQPPPLTTVSGPLLGLALEQGFGFLPLRGERDRQSELGAAVPIGGWTLDVSAFRNEARNFFDHDVLGNSNIFFPLTIDRAHIRGFEGTLASPPGARASLHVSYSHQIVQGEGDVVGGLTDFSPPAGGRFFLDHDQRNTLSAGGTVHLPRSIWIGTNVNYGSGFLNGDGPDHLPGHTTFDVAVGTVFGAWTAKVSATNLTNRRYLLDLSNTFGGTHYNEPLALLGAVGWRFHY